LFGHADMTLQQMVATRWQLSQKKQFMQQQQRLVHCVVNIAMVPHR